VVGCKGSMGYMTVLSIAINLKCMSPRMVITTWGKPDDLAVIEVSTLQCALSGCSTCWVVSYERAPKMVGVRCIGCLVCCDSVMYKSSNIKLVHMSFVIVGRLSAPPTPPLNGEVGSNGIDVVITIVAYIRIFCTKSKQCSGTQQPIRHAGYYGIW